MKASQRPVILLTGDIVDDGKLNQYKRAVDILSPLVEAKFKVMASPGNHDYGHYGIRYEEAAQDRFRKYILADLLNIPKAKKAGVTLPDLYPLKNTMGDVVFIGLDSVVGNKDEALQLASGEVGATQRELLAEMLQEIGSDKKVVVYFHHHPFYRNLFKRIALELDDAKEVMTLLSGRANLVCFGHKHVSHCWPDDWQIDWILASGKSTKRTKNYKFQFREVLINGEDSEVNLVTFKRD